MEDEKVLIMLTSEFPYGNKEAFIESEQVIFNKFSEVVIIPCHDDIPPVLRNSIFHNVNINVIRLEDSIRTLSALKLVYKCLKGMFNLTLIKEILLMIKKGSFTITKLKELLSFVVTGDIKVSEIKKVLNKKYSSESIIFYSYWMHIHAYIALKLKESFPGSKAITRCHGYDLYEFRHDSNYIPLRKYILENEDAIFAISEDGKKYIDQKYNDFSMNVAYSRLGTIDNGFNQNRLSRLPLKIISCSNLVEVKRVHKIIEALNLIDEFEIIWKHYGDGILLEGLRALSNEKLSLKHNISFSFEGAKPNSEIIKDYKNNDYNLFLNVSEMEGVPVSIMEALSFGIPAIATNVGGTKEIVITGVTGYLIDKDFSSESLATKIKFLNNLSEQEYEELRISTRQFWESECNAEKKYYEFYNTICNL
ncbi:glycosyltransferase [Paenibacillus sp. FSL R7-0345]|uniref:glycosyltransferase n=1 Tax=Paenibacillus sp. FSL R7-0345 TaxID=2954535 RepID=UPI00315A3D4A